MLTPFKLAVPYGTYILIHSSNQHPNNHHWRFIMSTPITFAMLRSFIQAQRAVPKDTQCEMKAAPHKFMGRGVKPLPLPTFAGAQLARVRIQDEAMINTTLARIAIEASRFGLELAPVNDLNPDGKTYTARDEVHFTTATATGSGLWLEARLHVPLVSI
jgi:hypothetical protein